MAERINNTADCITGIAQRINRVSRFKQAVAKQLSVSCACQFCLSHVVPFCLINSEVPGRSAASLSAYILNVLPERHLIIRGSVCRPLLRLLIMLMFLLTQILDRDMRLSTLWLFDGHGWE